MISTLHYHSEALSGQFPFVPYSPWDFPVHASKPVVSWLHLFLL